MHVARSVCPHPLPDGWIDGCNCATPHHDIPTSHSFRTKRYFDAHVVVVYAPLCCVSSINTSIDRCVYSWFNCWPILSLPHIIYQPEESVCLDIGRKRSITTVPLLSNSKPSITLQSLPQVDASVPLSASLFVTKFLHIQQYFPQLRSSLHDCTGASRRTNASNCCVICPLFITVTMVVISAYDRDAIITCPLLKNWRIGSICCETVKAFLREAIVLHRNLPSANRQRNK